MYVHILSIVYFVGVNVDVMSMPTDESNFCYTRKKKNDD